MIFPSSCQTRFLFQIPSVFRIHLHFLFPSQSGPTLGSVFSHHRTASTVLPKAQVGRKPGAYRTEIQPGVQQGSSLWTWKYALGSWCTHHFEDLGAQGLVCDMSLKYLICYKTSKNLSVQKRKWKSFSATPLTFLIGTWRPQAHTVSDPRDCYQQYSPYPLSLLAIHVSKGEIWIYRSLKQKLDHSIFFLQLIILLHKYHGYLFMLYILHINFIYIYI